MSMRELPPKSRGYAAILLAINRKKDDSYPAVTVADEGYKALKMATANHSDLVLLGVNLPGVDGFEILRKIRNSSLPVRGMIYQLSC